MLDQHASGQLRCSNKTWCGRRESNPHRPFEPCGFSYRLRLSPPGCCSSLHPVCGLDYPSTVSRMIGTLGAARLVSTPSRLGFSGLGSGLPFKVSPNLSSSASPVSQASTQVFLKSAAYAIPPRPRAAALLMIGHVARFYTSVSWSAGSADSGLRGEAMPCKISDNRWRITYRHGLE